MMTGAVLSECGLFRYHLLRRWDATLRTLVFVMLNPSTADGTINDATIRRCIAFARALGYGGIEVINLYAFRATDPADLRKAGYPVGPLNDDFLGRIAEGALRGGCDVCAAWGGDAAKLERAAQVLRFFERAGVQVQCLGLTKDGLPRHPLYLRGDSTLRPIRPIPCHA